MMKKLLYCLLCACLLLTSCNNDSKQLTMHEEEAKGINPYVTVSEEKAEEQVANIDWEKILTQIPSDEYIQLDGMHSVPLSATLYKNEKKSDLDVNDPRLIRLLNFYNNEVYCGIYSLSQGTVNEAYEKDIHCDFKLEIIFLPNDGNFSTIENSFDKMLIVGDSFYGVRTYIPFENYTYSSFLRIPLYDVGNLNWLTVFGF